MALNRALDRELAVLSRAITRFEDQFQGNFVRSIDGLSKIFNSWKNLPAVKGGFEALGKINTELKKIEPVMKKSLALNQNVMQNLSMDQIKASLQLGVGLDSLMSEVISLNETGVTKLDKSTILLAARMKATDQSTASLVKFLGANTSVLMLNQKQAQELAKNLTDYSRIYQMRQDEILNLATSMSKSFAIQSQLGSGAALTEAFAAIAAPLGARGSELSQQMAQFLSKATLSQLQLLGIAEGFQERIAAETSTEGRAMIAREMAKAAAAQVEKLRAGLGTDATSAQILKQILQPFGGESALVFTQFTKALEDAKPPIYDLSQSLTTFTGLSEAFALPMKLFAAAVAALISAPFIKDIVKVVASIAGAIAPIFIGAKIMRAVTATQALIALINQRTAQTNMGAAVITAAAMGPLTAATLLLAGVFGLGAGIWGAMNDNLGEINKKTPDPEDRTRTQAGLSGQIFSQLIDIVSSNGNNAIQKELLASTKQLVRLAQDQYAINQPNSGMPTPIKRVTPP
jgi:hypothetical protein